MTNLISINDLKLVKSKVKVTLSGKKSLEDYVYVATVNENHKDFEGLVTYTVLCFVLAESKKGILYYDELQNGDSRVLATYKKSTWLKLFGHLTKNEMEENKQQYQIEQMAYNKSDFWGLEADQWEAVPIGEPQKTV